MDRLTVRYSLAAAVILTVVTIAVSAMAESGQYQPPSRPVDPDARLPGVVRLEQFLNRNGVTGLNAVKGQPAVAAQPAQPAAEQPVQPQQPRIETVVLTPPPAAAAPSQPAVSQPRETMAAPVNPPMIRIAAPAFNDAPVIADGAPMQDASILYAPPVRAPWWERLLASREFLYTAIFCLIVVPAGALAASTILGRRREERDLALYD